MDDLISRQDDRGVSLKSVKHVLYDVCLHEDNMALFSKLLDRVNKLRDWEEYLTIKQEPSGDMIQRQAVLETLDDMDYVLDEDRTIENYKELLKECYEVLPPVRPQEPTGHWIGIDEEPHEDYECDKCGYTISTYTANIEPHTEYKYCPQCGAKMVEEQERSE